MSRHPELSVDERRETAHTLAVGALRFYLLKWTRNSLIAFDFEEALSTQGETGPYCQYAAVRANSIFRKLQDGERGGAFEAVRAAAGGGESAEAVGRVFEGENGAKIWSLVTAAARLDEAVEQAAELEEPSHLAKYTFGLAQSFNIFYNNKENSILKEQDPARRAALVVIADLVRKQLTAALSVLGIEVPARM
jgi:arginyl-tRNA synthetase